MSENRAMLCETADGVFGGVDEVGFEEGWSRIEAIGFDGLLVAEDAGGFGGDQGDLFAVQRLAGWHALPLPVGEHIVATALVARAGIARPAGLVSLAAQAEGAVDAGRFSGVLRHVPWGRRAGHALATVDGHMLLLDARQARVEAGESPAGEPRDTLTFADTAVTIVGEGVDLGQLGAFLRVAQMAGALDRVLGLAIDHANQRSQFGKPLAKFQAVQQNLAVLAVEAAAVNSAGQAAAAAMDRGLEDGGLFEIAAAKLRANMAVGTGVAIAHQVHGAIGFTAEYPLHRFTRRMIGWRSECGNDRHWAERLGRATAALGGAGLWQEITRRSDMG